MKNYLFFIFLGTFFSSSGQSKIIFSYDTAGNQIKRELCISGCLSSKQSNPPKELASLTEDDLLKFSPEDVLSYYPNPVKEELYLTWQVYKGNAVKSIQIFNVSGQILNSFPQKTQGTNNQNISFQSYPTGIYLVALIYIDGDKKTIKIIKQ
jgi:hypothetical protein